MVLGAGTGHPGRRGSPDTRSLPILIFFLLYTFFSLLLSPQRKSPACSFFGFGLVLFFALSIRGLQRMPGLWSQSQAPRKGHRLSILGQEVLVGNLLWNYDVTFCGCRFTLSVDGQIAAECQMSILDPLEKGQVTPLVSKRSNWKR